MNENITILPCEVPKCAICGRDLPKSRKKWCFACKPQKASAKWASAAQKSGDPSRYTLSDRAAQAKAYGLSYGQLMGKLYAGDPLPALRHKIRWPRGSHHRGE